MKIAHIVPAAYKNPSEDYVMLLAHLMDNKLYVDNNLKPRQGKYIIMDNSIIELGNAMTIEKLCNLAEEHLVNEIILPDVFKNKDATITSTLASLEYIEKRYKGKRPFKVMAVPQGTSLAEWWQCYEILMAEDIDVIGIPKVLDIMQEGGRSSIVGEIATRPASSKEYHLLGSHIGLEDFKYYKQYHSWVRGIDSCIAYIVARDYRFEDVSPEQLFKIPRPKETINFEDPYDMHIRSLLNYITLECEILP